MHNALPSTWWEINILEGVGEKEEKGMMERYKSGHGNTPQSDSLDIIVESCFRTY